MLKEAIYHEAKSKYAYAVDKDTIHLRLRTKKDDVNHVYLVYGDPFKWVEQDNEYVWIGSTTEKLNAIKEYSTELYDFYFVSVQPDHKRMKYSFILEDSQETLIYGAHGIHQISNKDAVNEYNLFDFFNFPYINPEDIYHAPSWVKETIWYQIFPERFHNGDDTTNTPNTRKWNDTQDVTNQMFFGGDLKGIIQKLPYIKEMGFNGIYFTPIFESPSNHKYDTTDYYKIDPAFGTNEIFKELVDTAHKLDIKVMLDAVFNHCGFSHPYFQDVVQNGAQSKYYNSFYITGDPIINFPLDENNLPDRKKISWDKGIFPNYDTFAFTPFMPKWNTDDTLAKSHLLDVSKYWIEKFNIDGWRLDVSNEVSHSFWREFRQTVHNTKKDVYILGENWDNSIPWLMGDQMDAVMNYEFLFGIWGFFGFPENQSISKKLTPTEFKYSINNVFVNYPKPVLQSMFNMIDSHDTARILHVCNESIDLVKLPYLFQFSLPGTPSVYYGGEIGLSGGHDPLNRRCMIWNESKQNKDLKSHIKQLIRLRKEHPEFQSTAFEWVATLDAINVIIYRKEQTYFIINNSEKNVSFNLPSDLQNTFKKDIYKNSLVELGDTLTLAKYQFMILK